MTQEIQNFNKKLQNITITDEMPQITDAPLRK